MDDKIKKYLFDIHEAILSIESYLDGKRDFNVYLQNKMYVGLLNANLKLSARQ
ncbi:MAG: hypothetical protein LBG45_02995 [Dysgonamonadaceae bacterium]|jgi:uncharacterized protein with HEPN domain|nr:hypothetical protein [Dysgonamonadaceae bacterium]